MVDVPGLWQPGHPVRLAQHAWVLYLYEPSKGSIAPVLHCMKKHGGVIRMACRPVCSAVHERWHERGHDGLA
jgi:hypothetical protein